MHRPIASSSVFHAIADDSRRALLDRLRLRPLNAGELAAGFAMSRPAVAKHLKVLHDAGLVATEKTGREVIYRLCPAPLAAVQDWLTDYRGFWESSLNELKRHLEKG